MTNTYRAKLLEERERKSLKQYETATSNKSAAQIGYKKGFNSLINRTVRAQEAIFSSVMLLESIGIALYEPDSNEKILYDKLTKALKDMEKEGIRND